MCVCVCTYLCECEVDAVSEWSDDQSAVQAHVLVSVGELSRTLTHVQVVRFFDPVKSQLTFPLEVTSVRDTAETLTYPNRRFNIDPSDLLFYRINLLTNQNPGFCNVYCTSLG